VTVTVTVIAEQGSARDPDVFDPVAAGGPIDRFCSLAFEGVGSR
jgi:hypothetical protein